MALDNQARPAGVRLDNGTCITHGTAAGIKRPLQDAPVVMHELYDGGEDGAGFAFKGQFGFIEFNTGCRLPRHVHIIEDGSTGNYRLLPERILVLNGVGITELGGEYFIVAPGSLVDIPPGLPHTWNACPAGVRLPDGTLSDGTFTMVYNYSEKTSFFPTAETGTLASGADYVRHEGDVEDIRFPVLTAQQAAKGSRLVWNDELHANLTAG